MKALPTHTSLNSFIIQPESYGATVDEGFIVGGPVGDFELLLCHGTVCVVGKMRDLIGFVNGMVASHLLCHSGTINRHSLNGALLS